MKSIERPITIVGEVHFFRQQNAAAVFLGAKSHTEPAYPWNWSRRLKVSAAKGTVQGILALREMDLL